jgi:hypothetical protein
MHQGGNADSYTWVLRAAGICHGGSQVWVRREQRGCKAGQPSHRAGRREGPLVLRSVCHQSGNPAAAPLGSAPMPRIRSKVVGSHASLPPAHHVASFMQPRWGRIMHSGMLWLCWHNGGWTCAGGSWAFGCSFCSASVRMGTARFACLCLAKTGDSLTK